MFLLYLKKNMPEVLAQCNPEAVVPVRPRLFGHAERGLRRPASAGTLPPSGGLLLPVTITRTASHALR